MPYVKQKKIDMLGKEREVEVYVSSDEEDEIDKNNILTATDISSCGTNDKDNKDVTVDYIWKRKTASPLPTIKNTVIALPVEETTNELSDEDAVQAPQAASYEDLRENWLFSQNLAKASKDEDFRNGVYSLPTSRSTLRGTSFFKAVASRPGSWGCEFAKEEEAKHAPYIKGLLLTGEGKAFCAGADINQLAGLSAEEGLAFAKRGQNVFLALETLGKPSIAAVNGFAFGGGCELAMSATLRIAAKPAKFGQPEVKLGVIPGFGGTQRLARLVGKGRALDLCLTGRFINSDDALAWGLITEITEPDDLLARAETILLGILEQGPLAVRAVMEVIQGGYDLNLTDALHLEAVQFALTCASEDKNEGVQAFLTKRKAVFTGK